MKTSFKLPLLLVGISTACAFSVQAYDYTMDNLTVNVSATGVLPTVGVRYVIVEQKATDTAVQRGTKLNSAYIKAKTCNLRPPTGSQC